MTMQQHVFTIAQSCEQAGISHAIICPGSRSAPLVYAFTQSAIDCKSVVDERSAAYIALGIAQQTRKPVVLICTSGTAALNFFPAIAEAFYQQVSLLVLTADRPPELLNQQDGQMIMQKDVYGGHVKASFELPCYPSGQEHFQETQSLMEKALFISKSPAAGPVHVNIPLAEPLYPNTLTNTTAQGSPPQNIVEPLRAEIPDSTAKTIQSLWQKASKKLIVVGQSPCNAQLTAALIELQSHGNTVIVCDILSNQYSFNTASHLDYLMMRADSELLKEMEPDLILSFGGPVLSKAFKKWLKQLRPATHIRFNEPNRPIDTYQNVTHAYEAAAAPVLFKLALNHKTAATPQRYQLFWQQANKVIAATIDRYTREPIWSELHVMNQLLDRIPDVSNVQVGNSSMIRYISYLGNINPSWVLNGNRGTSGIDGSTSTAVGAALVNNRPTFLLTGDIAFLYDINALWNPLPPNLKIIVFNNNGGGIFQLIDGPGKQPEQLNYFTTPHQQNIEALCGAKGIKHFKAFDAPSLSKILSRFFDPTTPAAILEITFDRDANAEEFERFKKLTFA
jgi:2-succinyl-5-enolpyruvyl-6-hydroxy-3-cyclohexene-1-carboxylate synthase